MTGISSSATNSSNGGSATQGGLDAVRNPGTDQVDVSTNERNRLTAQSPTSLDSLSASPSTTDIASVPANVFAEFVFEGKLEADIRVAVARDTAQ